ncbi:MAG: IS3 family transposase [Thermoleophilaceae bacterium]
MTIFGFIAARKAEHSIKLMCRVLGVSRSGFHAWERREPSRRSLNDAWLTEQIARIHGESRNTYGSPRVHAELRLEHGVRVGRKRVERLMRRAGLSGQIKRRRGRTTIRVQGVRTAPDLVERDFNPATINRLWAADITYIRTWEGWLYLASVMDLYSRRIVGWAMADHLRAELVVDALEMAVARRRPDAGLVHHSDQGSQYTSLVFTQRCRAVGIDVSMGSRGDCFDNSVLESFHATLKKDLIHRRSWPTKTEARTAVFDYIEAFYNRRRRHSLLAMLSPADFETSTLGPDGAGFAATRLASTNKIMFTATTAKAA